MGLHAAAACAALALLATQQPPTPAWLKPAGRVTVQVVVEPPQKGAPPGRVMLAIDVTPAPGIHVYAPGNKDYIPVSVTIDTSPSVTPEPPVFPRSELLVFGELHETVQVFKKAFRVRQPLTVERKDGGALTITGRLRFQACTDKVCFPPESLPLTASLPER